MLKILEFQVLIIFVLVEMEGVSSSLLFLFPRQVRSFKIKQQLCIFE